eukprot:CAMPEP_0113394340 /NCGR_PEP_ID=MMETSP0013_2-20120614/12442_1 /TAXON_ID=2843 ORGANISM="Skeletonema costatum, Strain 1716" /NCGR_SAMPLE_ID=MMETSP0013_2 /ASSEMBLY_ACC=CAM_ASM_000158 /LENGTH=1048 /DNA_ID=CAMNT_0000278145 /DNA_START=75 /DNA_END=3221 /DNA_ORIENTATION=+ /assembly_acc=CAM_ASM_000158
MSSDQPSPPDDTASAGNDAQPSEAAAAASSHKVLTYSRSRSSAKTGGNDTLRKNDKAAKTYHAQRTVLSIILATLVTAGALMSGLRIGQIIGNKYFVQGNLNIDTVITDLFSIISFPSAYAESSSSSDDDDDDSSDDNGNNNPYHCLRENPDGSCRTWSNVQHFFNHMGEMETKWSTCNTDYDEDNEHSELIDSENSLYQKVFFEENLFVGDKCLWLDHTMQQCAAYRPHYHEPFVHLSAAYTDVKRVVFVGGGDSMLLHEVLKYPSLEMVLGLELDQVVTRNSFEHFKTQPHFDDERVQWWFGDGAKSLTLLPREYFGTFDLVLLDLSETVMSMTVTEGLDVFGAMKLLLSPTGIMVKNDFGYFEGLSRVFDTCIQLDIQDVFYICDYELVLCGTDQVDFLNPKFDHLKGVEGSTFNVDTLVYKPQEEGRDDHWGPLTDYSKYWGEPRDCLPPGTAKKVDDESIAYAGVLMIVEAENVSNMESISELEGPLKQLGYTFITTSSQPSEKSGGMKHVIVLEEGYLLMESWPDANYCKIDIHLWGRFEKQESIRSKVLDMLGSKEGDWQSYRIVTGGVRGCHTRADDLKSTGPDLSIIGVCDDVREGSSKSVVLDASSDDEAVLGPIIEAGLDEIIPTVVGAANGKDAIVICGPKGSPCRAKANLEKKGYDTLTTFYSCPLKEDEMDRGKWREQLSSGGDSFPEEFVICGRKAGDALKDISRMSSYPQVVVVDALAPSEHVSTVHDHFVEMWVNHIDEPFVFFVPIIDATDEQRTSFIKSRFNIQDKEPEFYSEIYAGDGDKTMSFGLVHAGTSASFLRLRESLSKLDRNDHVKFSDLRRVSIRGAARFQTDYDPVTFKQDDYDQQPGLEQFYGQRAIGLQTVFQLALKDAEESLTALSISDAANAATKSMSKGVVEESFHEMGEGALYVALMPNAQVVVTWDGAGSVNVNIFTYDETVNHKSRFVSKFKASLPSMNLVLKDEFPRGYGKVINKSDKVNRGESPSCYDHYKLCQKLSKAGRCEDDAKDFTHLNCRFSCGLCEKDDSRDEL